MIIAREVYIAMRKETEKKRNEEYQKKKEFYEKEQYRIEKEISDLWEVEKKSKAKEHRLEEIKLILTGLDADREIKRLASEKSDLLYLLRKNDIEIPEGTEKKHNNLFLFDEVNQDEDI